MGSMTRTLAQINATTLPTYFPAAKNFTNIGNLTSVLIPTFMAIAALTFLVMLFYGGFKLMTSQGEPDAITSARSTITWGIVGLIIMTFAYMFLKLIGYILQVPIPF
jgi:FtsH-binding integral membrane protein